MLIVLLQIIDVYMMHANSAIAANTIPRSMFGAGFPMFGRTPSCFQSILRIG